jgi:hypothetical protein
MTCVVPSTRKKGKFYLKNLGRKRTIMMQLTIVAILQTKIRLHDLL